MAPRAERRTSRIGLVVSIVAVLSVVGACASPPRPGEGPPDVSVSIDDPATPLPLGTDTIRISADQHGALVARGVSQQYRASYGSGDHQRLMVGRYPGSSRHGPLVAIQPNDSSIHVDRARLAAGFVVARFVNRETRSYPKLGILGNDTTYWFVDSLPSGTWRSRYVSSRFTGVIVEDTTLVIHPSDTTHARSLARWVWMDSDETGWVTCTSAGCCTSRNALRTLTAFGEL